MKVIKITTNHTLLVTPLGDRLYRVGTPIKITIATDEGTLVYSFKEGFITNFRSGGPLVDRFVDQIGDAEKAICYLVHDAAYTPCKACDGEHPISKALADTILRESLILAGMSKWKARIVYTIVYLFGDSAYEDDDNLTFANSKLFSFEWRDK